MRVLGDTSPPFPSVLLGCPHYKEDALSAPILSDKGYYFASTLVARFAILQV